MKIVHVNQTDSGGGAAIACIRHAEAMTKVGHNVLVITSEKYGHNPIVKKPHWGWRSFFSLIKLVLYERLLRQINAIGTFSVMRYGMPFSRLKEVREADVIFIHWVNNNAMSLRGIENILKLGKPTYWYMHDMFPITGGCHHSLTCDGYVKECLQCPLIKSNKCKSVSSKQLRKKLKFWCSFSNLEFVTPSKWLGECVKNSKIGHDHRIHVIPNVINTDIYRPLDIDTKDIWGLNRRKKTILFGAAEINSIYKGAQYAHDCLKGLDPNMYEGLFIGNINREFIKDLSINIVETGFLSDDISKVFAYNACDTFIISSIAENYPNMVLEAMACGKPCVGFRSGGIPDLISHKKTGFLTEEKTPDALIKGIDYLFEDQERYSVFSTAARNQIVKNNGYCNIKDIHTEIKL